MSMRMLDEETWPILDIRNILPQSIISLGQPQPVTNGLLMQAAFYGEWKNLICPID